MGWIVRLVLLLPIVVNAGPLGTPSTPCLIHGTIFGSTIGSKGSCKGMKLVSVNITQPSKELFMNLTEGLDSLHVEQTQIAAVYLPSNLTELDVIGSRGGQMQVIVDRKATYKLQRITLQELPQLPANIGTIRSLKVFECIRIRGAGIDLTMFAKMIQLEKISIIESGCVTIPNPFQLPSIRRLDIYSSEIKSFTGTGCRFPNLERLDLSNNSLQVIPECFKTAKTLRYFHVNENQLRTVTLDDFTNLKQLEKLSLSENQLSELKTKRVVHLPRLESLYLGQNRLTELSVKLWIMPALQYLALENNLLKQVTGLAPLLTRKVPALLIYDNPWDCQWMNATLQQFPGIRVLMTSKGPCFPFEKLYLENKKNNFQVIPEYVTTTKSLTWAGITKNKFGRVTVHQFTNLKQLKVLNLRETQNLALITTRALHLPCLITLNLYDNKLTELNVGLWIFPALQTLRRANNQLKKVKNLLPVLVRTLLELK